MTSVNCFTGIIATGQQRTTSRLVQTSSLNSASCPAGEIQTTFLQTANGEPKNPGIITSIAVGYELSVR